MLAQTADLYDAWKRVTRAEADAWMAVKDRLPGMPLHDRQAWELWGATVALAEEARKALRAAYALPER